MAQQTINIGSSANDGTGDDLRAGGDKINDNFTELYTGAVFTTDADASGYSFVIDEDNMASDSATKIPTQQSVKAYVDANSGGTVDVVSNVATSTILGRVTAGSGDSEELTATQVRTLLNVEDGADVTDATNVDAAGATMNTDTDVSGNSWVLDEDDMTSDSATKVPTQQSVKAYVDANAGGSQPFELIVAVSDETTDLTTGTAKVTFRMPDAVTLTAVRASVTTAPTGAALTVDINEGGVSILSTKLTIDAGEKTSTTAATAAVISDSSLADDAEMTIDIDQIGSTIAGAGLKVTLIGTRT